MASGWHRGFPSAPQLPSTDCAHPIHGMSRPDFQLQKYTHLDATLMRMKSPDAQTTMQRAAKKAQDSVF